MRTKSDILFGASLIEVLVSLALFALMLLAFHAQVLAFLRTRHQAYEAQIAMEELRLMSEKLYIIKDDDELLAEVERWNEHNRALLPEGKGVIAGSYPEYHLSLGWGGQKPPCQEDRYATGGCLRMRLDVS